MSLQKILCESNEQLVHTEDPCVQELGRVRGIILFDTKFDIETFVAKLQSGIDTDALEVINLINTGIEAGTVYIIPQTKGTYNGGEAHKVDGYQDGETRVLWYEHELQFTDPSYRTNRTFWQQVELRTWYMAWRTESLLQVSTTPANVYASNPVGEELTSTVAWNTVASWRSKYKPEIVPLAVLSDYFTDSTTTYGDPVEIPVPHRVAEWGHITGKLDNQTDLTDILSALTASLSSKQDTIPDLESIRRKANKALKLAKAGL